MLGWIDKTTALQIESGQVMQITKKSFNNELILRHGFQLQLN